MRKPLMVLILFLTTALVFGLTRNTDKPLKGEWDFKMKKVWEIEGAGEEDFAEIRDIIATGSGRIFVADSRHIKIYILNNDGQLLSSFGKSGEGPGEFRTFRNDSQLHLLNNYLIVSESNRIHYFTLDGQFVKTVTLPNVMDPRAFISENTFISALSAMIDPRIKKADIKLYNIKKKKEKKIATYRLFEKAIQQQESSGRQMVVAIVLGGITPMMMVEHRNGKIYYGMSDQYKIEVVDLTGKKIGGFYLENREQNPVSDRFKKDLLNRMKSRGNAPEEMLQRIVDGLPEKASYFENIVVDKKGYVYVFIADPGENTQRSIDIFSPKGKYLYSATIKVPEDLNMRRIYLRDKLLLLALEDEEGVLKLVKYDIRIPSY